MAQRRKRHGKTATLTADTINDTGNTGGSPTIGSTPLDHGQSAYVPVDNEDQYYVEDGNNNLIPNVDQGLPIQHDWALLPFNVQVADPSAGQYYLDFDNSVRIFTSSDANPENMVTSGAIINSLLDGNGKATIYIEGIQQDAGVQIKLDKIGQAAPLDTLNVVVFQFQGPQNVPNYSTYTYSVSGIPDGGGEGNWSLAAGSGGSAIVSTAGEDQVGIQWGTGAGNGSGRSSPPPRTIPGRMQ